ncbi:MAG: cation:proton antiporter [Candidatus Kapabacteria bacterium]|nr:cation:proton antiporter [Candidatus Kapabacteria bacterium]
MNTYIIIIVLSAIVLASYFFDFLSSKIKIPSVIVLIISGIGLRLLTDSMNIQIPMLSAILPPLGTLGLVLIVLEGSLDLTLSRKKIILVKRASLSALILILLTSAAMTALIIYVFYVPILQALVNAIPLAVISSAVAIPSAQGLAAKDQEFIVYESSLSDILGVVLFNFVAEREDFGLSSVGEFGLNISLTIFLAVVACLGLALLITHIRHHIKFLPIISVLLLIYASAKVWHLSPLLIVLLFGLFANNAHLITNIKFAEFFRLERMEEEVHKFRHLTAEMAFVIRTFFFIIFGYLADISGMLHWEVAGMGALIVAIILLLRIAYLTIAFAGTERKIFPIALIAPRGLITILLFLSIGSAASIPGINQGLLMTVVIGSSLAMMFGIMLTSNTNKRLLENV